MARPSDITMPYLRAWRADRGMTQSELAHAARVARGTVLRAENGAGVNAITVVKLARALGITVQELRTENPEEKNGKNGRRI